MDLVRMARPCTVDDWTKAMYAETSDTENHQVIDTLSLLLDGKASSIDTARNIVKIYEDSLKDVPNKVHVFWALWLSDAIRRFDNATKPLVSLMVEISRQPEAINIGGFSREYINNVSYWRHSPG